MNLILARCFDSILGSADAIKQPCSSAHATQFAAHGCEHDRQQSDQHAGLKLLSCRASHICEQPLVKDEDQPGLAILGVAQAVPHALLAKACQRLPHSLYQPCKPSTGSLLNQGRPRSVLSCDLTVLAMQPI